MFPFITITLALYGMPAEPQLDPEQLRDLIRTKTAPLKSLVFIYEGGFRYKNNPTADVDYQGTFLYQSDKTAYYDVYKIFTAHSAGVVRTKAAAHGGRVETASNLLDSQQRIGKKDVKSLRGSLTSLNSQESPLDLCAIWSLQGLYDDVMYREISIDGWETVDERNCLRVRGCSLANAQDQDKERSKRIYWLDLDRNAQVLKAEFYQNRKLVSRIEDVHLAEYSLPGGTSYWFPVHSRRRTFVDDPEVATVERTISLVADSEQFNLDLPDSLFNVARDTAYPTPNELARIEAKLKAGVLGTKFQAQPHQPDEPFRTDPVSVRQRIEDGLAEANRQSKELEASSPARQTWSGTTLIQVGLGIVGVALLGFVAIRKWRGE